MSITNSIQSRTTYSYMVSLYNGTTYASLIERIPWKILIQSKVLILIVILFLCIMAHTYPPFGWKEWYLVGMELKFCTILWVNIINYISPPVPFTKIYSRAQPQSYRDKCLILTSIYFLPKPLKQNWTFLHNFLLHSFQPNLALNHNHLLRGTAICKCKVV